MKKIVFMAIFAFGLIGISLDSHAQQKPFSPYSAETMDAINATSEQREAMRAMLDSFKPKFKALKDSQDSMSKEEYEAQWKKLTSERSREYTKLWTPEQTKKLRELRTTGIPAN